MAERELNRLAGELRDFCGRRQLEEKWLLAPSRRIGFQWMDSVARSGRPLLNLRVKTIASMTLELASPLLEKRGLSLVRGPGLEVLVDRVVARLPGEGYGYLSRLEAGPSLVLAVGATLRDMRLAGLSCGELEAGSFEVPAKGRELALLLQVYEDELRRGCLVDYADALRAAADSLRDGRSPFPDSAFMLMPEDMERELAGLERSLWEAAPSGRRVVLGVDRPETETGGEVQDARLLAWINHPAQAPPARGDGTADIFRSVGEINEGREVLRRCVEEKLSFDEVEIIPTDTSQYVPLLYELACRLRDGEGRLPVTFSEGIPVSYSRPGRALAGWLSWLREDYSQSVLVRMVQDGLLRIEGAEGLGFTRLGAHLRALPIGSGRDRYLEVIDAHLAALERGRHGRPASEENDGHEEPSEEAASRRKLGLLALRGLVCRLLELDPASGKRQPEILADAVSFLENEVRRGGELDEYSRLRLVEVIGEMADSLRDGDLACVDPLQWLSELVNSLRVEGQGPRPGCLYVSSIAAGGHSGRRHTFIIGMDDSRFPGPGLQDSLLLDAERERISGELPTAAARLERRMEDLEYLMSRLRGRVTLGYCFRSLTDDREMFPSPAVLNAYRILSGQREGDYRGLSEWMKVTSSFAPSAARRCLDFSDWWLWRLCGEESPGGLEDILEDFFPHLARGLEARRARESDRFTEYDGLVPEAGADLDPARPGGPVISASRLEKLGSCPLEYFLRYVLEIEPPEEYAVDPTTWLDPMEKGSLLHAAFREFMQRLQSMGRRPELKRDRELMAAILEGCVAEWAGVKPPPNPQVFNRQRRELHQTARIFLQEEEELCRESLPAFFEASIGLPPVGAGSPMDTPNPVEIRLPGGSTVRVRGRIDRVDDLGDGAFSLWDYKTGSSRGYLRGDPFRGGRKIQNALYLELARARLEELRDGASVASFGYFFPNIREHGERIRWSSVQLERGGEVIEKLCRMLAAGCFPFSDDPDDVRWSDYRAAFWNADEAAEAVRSKLANLENEVLAPFRELRGYDRQDG